MSFNPFRKNKILAKIPVFTVNQENIFQLHALLSGCMSKEET